MSKGRLLYAQSGGVTAVINTTACAVIETCRRHRITVYAARNGIIGALREELIDLAQEQRASIAALQSLGARRLAIGTAYIDEVNEVEAKYLTERGFDVLAIHGLNLLHDSEIIRVSPNFIRDFACSIDRPDADAIFLSCGALRAVEVIDEIEQIVGKPVVTSNQALLWHCLKLAGVDERPRKCGRLMQNY